MLKKLLINSLLIFSILLTLASCGIKRHTHSYDAWEILTDPTCTTAGTKARYCSCGETQTATIPSAGHTYSNGVCTVCGSQSAGGSSIPLTESEWLTALDPDQYQSYVMHIEITDVKSSYSTETVETTVTYSDPYYLITTAGTEELQSTGYLTEELTYITGGTSALEKAAGMPTILSHFYSDLTELDDMGYSLFVFNASAGSYTSSLLDPYNVTIKITNGKINELTVVKEYYDVDYGNVTETCAVTLSGINTTQEPVAPFDSVSYHYSSALSSINSATAARKAYQSSVTYDLEAVVSDMNYFLELLTFEAENLYEYDAGIYTYIEYDSPEIGVESYYDITISVPVGDVFTVIESTVFYDKVNICIQDGVIENISLYNEAGVVFSVCFIYGEES